MKIALLASKVIVILTWSPTTAVANRLPVTNAGIDLVHYLLWATVYS